jgi:hypothetical protein
MLVTVNITESTNPRDKMSRHVTMANKTVQTEPAATATLGQKKEDDVSVHSWVSLACAIAGATLTLDDGNPIPRRKIRRMRQRQRCGCNVRIESEPQKQRH